MKLHRFEHLNLACKDIDASQAFYQMLFPDWYVRAQGGVVDGERWRHLGNDQFYLALNESSGDRLQHPYEGIGINHVGFVIDHGHQLKALLEANGIEYCTYESPETAHRIYVNDPDGNEIEFVEYKADYALR